MTFVLDQLAAALQCQRKQQEAVERAPSSNPSTEGDDSTPCANFVPDEAIDPRKAKHARLVEDTCNAYNLRSTKRLEVQDFSSLEPEAKQIVIFAHLQAITRDLALRDAKSFVTLCEGKEQVHDMLRILLLAPTNKSYVTGNNIRDFLRRDIVLHWDSWRVAQATTQDPDAMNQLLKHLLNHLTSLRNKIKELLASALRENWCINKLMNALAPDSMYVTEKHRERWSWILEYYTNSAKGNQFWPNLDKTLKDTEEVLAHQEPDLAARAALQEMMFEEALAAYRRRCPTKATARDTPYDAPSWQVGLEARLARNHSFTAIA
ncbi:hypothetical protein RhiJN_07685 [Ceratobasidium sp. AG-Ba]|nr:hypothetical protein RhiJN_07685 [Ceratobasidium sp. AG-Ba]